MFVMVRALLSGARKCWREVVIHLARQVRKSFNDNPQRGYRSAIVGRVRNHISAGIHSFSTAKRTQGFKLGKYGEQASVG